MRPVVQYGLAAILLVAAALLAFAIRQDRLGKSAAMLTYTEAVKAYDISESTRKALGFLNDAALREQSYVMTGQTVYSEAFAQDVRRWQDEFGTFQLLAEKDTMGALIQDLSVAATRAVKEMTEVISIYDTGAQDAAMARARKGSGVVYLDQARALAAEIQDAEGLAVNDAHHLFTKRTLTFMHRITLTAAILFCLIFAGVALLLFEMRRLPRVAPVRESREAACLSPAEQRT